METKLNTNITCPFCDKEIPLAAREQDQLTVDIFFPDPISFVPRRTLPTPYPVCESCYNRHQSGEDLPFTKQFVEQTQEYTKLFRYFFALERARMQLKEYGDDY